MFHTKKSKDNFGLSHAVTSMSYTYNNNNNNNLDFIFQAQAVQKNILNSFSTDLLYSTQFCSHTTTIINNKNLRN